MDPEPTQNNSPEVRHIPFATTALDLARAPLQVPSRAADDADGADGIFRPRMNPDHPCSGSAFTTERNLNTPYSKERLRTTQAASDASGLATARGFLGQPLAPIEAAANLNAGLPFDASQLTFISMSSQVTYVAPARARAASKAQIPDLRRDSARRSYRSMAVSCRSERTVAMHLNVHDEAELRVDKTPVLTSR